MASKSAGTDDEGEETLQEQERNEKINKMRRREIRLKQRDLLGIYDEDANEILDFNNGLYNETRDKKNAIFAGITHTREQLNDAIFVRKEAEKLNKISAS